MRCLAFRTSSCGMRNILHASGIVAFFIATFVNNRTITPINNRNMAFPNTVTVREESDKGKVLGGGSRFRPIM